MKKAVGLMMAGVMGIAVMACGSSSVSTKTANETEKREETPGNSGAATEGIDRSEGIAPGSWNQTEEFDKALAAMDLSKTIDGTEEKTLTMSTHVSETDSNYLYGLAFQRAVEALSGGAMKIDLYANGQLFGQADALQALQQGTLDIANSDTSLLANYNAAAGVLDLPFLFQSREQAVRAVQDEEIRQYIDSMIEGSGMHLLSILPLNFRNALCKDMNIDSVDDFEGFIMRVPSAPSTIAAFEAISATPTVIPSGEAYTAVQTGVADGLEGHAEYMHLQKFYEVAKNYVQTQHVFTFTDFCISKKVYDGLSDKQKKVIAAAADQALQVHLNYTSELFPAMYANLIGEGVKITEVDREPFIAATADYRDRFISDNNLKSMKEKIDSFQE